MGLSEEETIWPRRVLSTVCRSGMQAPVLAFGIWLQRQAMVRWPCTSQKGTGRKAKGCPSMCVGQLEKEALPG